MKKLTLLVFCLVLATGSGWAGVTGTTNPALFNDYVNWCQYGCGGGQFATPQTYVSGLGNTGSVGLVGTMEGFYNLQQGTSWNGNFANGMGLIYNGSAFGNIPTSIATTFDTGVFGAGAYIQANYFGAFTASLELFDVNYQSLGIYTTTGTADTNVGTALFIGAFDLSGMPDVYAAQFAAYGIGPAEPDFSIGSLGLATVPEPSSLLLLGTSVLGLAGYVRRRFKGVL